VARVRGAIIAATILTPASDGGPGLRVIRAVRLMGDGTQPTLRSVSLRRGRVLDPRSDDPFLAMIEERHRVAADGSRQERFLKVTLRTFSGSRISTDT